MLELQRYSEAIDALSNIPQKDQFTLLQLAAAHAYLGDNLAASEILANARLLRPGISIAEVAIVVPYAQNEQLEHLLVGLRKAGLKSLKPSHGLMRRRAAASGSAVGGWRSGW